MPDARVQAAVANWAPRFTTQGVDPNEFARVAGSVERWDDWLDAWVASGDAHRAQAEAAAAADFHRTAGEAYVRAALSYHFAKFVWTLDPAKNRAATEQAKAAMYAAHRHIDPTAERIEVTLDGKTLAGNLRRPAGGPAPLVVLIPGLDSTKEEFFYWEQVFIDRGMAALSMDGPGQGECGYDQHIRHDYEAAVAAFLDALQGRSDVDLTRIGAVGVSMGGYYAPRAAAFEPRIKAVSAIGGPYNFGACWDQLPGLTRETFVHHSGAADAEDGRRRAEMLNLEPVVQQITQPFLVVFGKQDRLIPWQQAVRLADEAPNGELVMYDEGNHVCNNMPYLYRPLVADWMARQLAD
jgi:dipeptidyl aminopeptidase/acylaminoacyl peptidase